MKKNIKLALALALALAFNMVQSVNAQSFFVDPHIDFEDSTDYKAVGVWDSWVESPFRTGQLQGNAKVIANHLQDETNISNKILGFQRSRLASNQYGVKVDLNHPMEIGPTTKYVHVMINRPNNGRCMLICLGKRTERVAQPVTVEQTWSFASNLAENTWCDAVFQVKSFSGVEIHSLVICPDVEAPHTLTSDFAVYVDDIVVNNSPTPRVLIGNYPVNATKDAKLSRSDRYTNTVNINVAGTAHAVNVGQQSSKNLYIDKTTDNPIPVRAGDQVTVTFGGSINWMNGFVYLDRDNDGKFASEGIVDGVIPEGSDVMSFSFVGGASGGYNSKGQHLTGDARNVLNPPAFTIPADLTPGIYRMRCKVDWADIDPYGSVIDGNDIVSNGGSIVDVLVNVHGTTATVNDNQLNGAVVTQAGEELNSYQAPFGQPFTIKMVPYPGFTYDGVRIRHGYNIEGDSLVHDNAQYRDIVYRYSLFNEQDELTLPAEVMDGDVLVEGLFVEEGHRNLYPVNFPKDQKYTRSDRHINKVSITQTGGAEQVVNVPFTTAGETLCYQDLTASTDTFRVQPGAMLTPKFNWTGNSMRGFVYVDFDNDGDFFTGWTDAVGGDFVSTSLNNAQPNLESNPTLPAFKAPMTEGKYRIRFKVDWDSKDPGGKGETPNYIIDNGGSITDLILKVEGAPAPVPQFEVSLLGASDLSGMSAGDKKTVLLGNPHKNNGYFLGYNGSGKVSTLFGASMTAGLATAESLEENGDYLMTLTKDANGKYTLESVGHPGTFLMDTPGFSSTSYAWTVNTNITPTSTTDMSAGWSATNLVRFITTGTNYLNSQGNVANLTFRSGTGEWSVWSLYEVIETAPVQKHNVTYNYFYDGAQFDTETKAVTEGYVFPAPKAFDFAAAISAPAGTVSQDTTFNFNVEFPDFPFKLSADYDNAVWYSIKMRDSRYVYYAPGNTVNEAQTADTAGDDDTYLWAFVGSPVSFRIINKSAGENLYLKREGEKKNVLSATATEFVAVADNNVYDGDRNVYIRTKDGVNQYINLRDNTMGYWDSANAKGEIGSALALLHLYENVTVSELGFATYSSEFALDFTDSDVKAYTCSGANAENDKLVMHQVEKVAAGTGLLVSAPEGTYQIPVLTDEAEELTQPNYFVAVIEYTENIPARADFTNYVLQNKNSKLGFYRVNYAEGQTLTMYGNRAYLQLPDSISDAKEFWGIDEDPTAIADVENVENVGNVGNYNLSGVRVGDGYKGVIIRNGRKVLVK